MKTLRSRSICSGLVSGEEVGAAERVVHGDEDDAEVLRAFARDVMSEAREPSAGKRAFAGADACDRTGVVSATRKVAPAAGSRPGRAG